MRIAIELDNIVRDNNSQALKYYQKGINMAFDGEIDLDCTDLLSELPFQSKESRSIFREIDYPYELFGCARTCHKHLHVEVEDWMNEHEHDEIIYFATNESNLIIQSTYFFLSKGSRVRTVIFPVKPEDIWNYCDIAITINKKVVESKPNNKQVVVIRKSDNKELQDNANLCYDNLLEFLKDDNFKEKLFDSLNVDKQNIINKNKTNFIKFLEKIWKKSRIRK